MHELLSESHPHVSPVPPLTTVSSQSSEQAIIEQGSNWAATGATPHKPPNITKTIAAVARLLGRPYVLVLVVMMPPLLLSWTAEVVAAIAQQCVVCKLRDKRIP